MRGQCFVDVLPMFYQCACQYFIDTLPMFHQCFTVCLSRCSPLFTNLQPMSLSMFYQLLLLWFTYSLHMCLPVLSHYLTGVFAYDLSLFLRIRTTHVIRISGAKLTQRRPNAVTLSCVDIYIILNLYGKTSKM